MFPLHNRQRCGECVWRVLSLHGRRHRHPGVAGLDHWSSRLCGLRVLARDVVCAGPSHTAGVEVGMGVLHIHSGDYRHGVYAFTAVLWQHAPCRHAHQCPHGTPLPVHTLRSTFPYSLCCLCGRNTPADAIATHHACCVCRCIVCCVRPLRFSTPTRLGACSIALARTRAWRTRCFPRCRLTHCRVGLWSSARLCS